MEKEKKNRSRRFVFLILILLWTGFIWKNSLAPSTESAKQSGVILMWINGVLDHLAHWEISEFVVRKAAHMFEFFVLAFLWSNVFATYSIGTKKAVFFPLGVTALTAVIDEVIQLYVPGRSGEIRDVCVDVCGAILGAILFKILDRRYKKASERC